MTEFARLLRYLRPYAAIFTLSIVLMMATGLLEGATNLLLVPIFNKLGDSKVPSAALSRFHLDQYFPSGGESTWHLIALLLVGLTLAKGVTEYFSSYSI